VLSSLTLPPAAHISGMLPDGLIPASPGPTVRHPHSGPVMAPDCPRSPPDTHEFVQNTQEFAGIWSFSRRRRDAANSTVPADDLLPDGLLHRSLHVGGKRRLFFGGVQSGQGDIRSGILSSPTETPFRKVAFSPKWGPKSRKRGSNSGVRGHFHVGEKRA
jgi:hypothetical protein